jgi:hypothetical protein
MRECFWVCSLLDLSCIIHLRGELADGDSRVLDWDGTAWMFTISSASIIL